MVKSNFVIKQFFETESSTYTYFIYNKKNKNTIIIDPVIESFDKDIEFIETNNLIIKYVLETHIHADHITSAGKLKQRYGCSTVIGNESNVLCADILIKDKDIIYLDEIKIEAISTPGHTNACTSYYIEDLNIIFSGDALLIGGNGRTDFQEGDARKLYHSIKEKIFKLPDYTKVYPAHDYKGNKNSTVKKEKKNNLRIYNKTVEEFIEIMNNLKLDKPKKIEIAVPLNLKCGLE